MEILSSAPECLPLKSFDDVATWTPKSAALYYTAASVPLATHVTLAHDRPRTLICHDMRGGYLHDRFTQGAADSSAYRCFHWQHVDVFVYFSHYFVTVPPPAWTNTCHRHDVLCLGTLITEWDDGKKNCEELLKSEESYRAFADKLVLIAEVYGFDGWLVNIENPIEGGKIETLVGFLTYLTSRMHAAVPRSQVIWYDSVVSTGELKWQDELNDRNELFFACTDGIFLNYGWKDQTLDQSATRAKARDRPWDVYVGVDVFGRGCYGGGGFNTCQAMEKIRTYGLSAAIFAPGWVYEKMEENFTQEEYRFWSLVVPYLYTKTVRSLPFATNFCQGQGQRFFQAGQPVSAKPWTNLSLQGVQPLLAPETAGAGAEMEAGVDMTDAWHGGGCLCLRGAFSNNAASQKAFRLFEFDAALPGTTVASFVYKKPANVSFSLVLEVENEEKKRRVYILGEGKAASRSGRSGVQCDVITPSTGSGDCPAMCRKLPISCNGWSSRIFSIPHTDGLTLREVTAHMSSDDTATQDDGTGSEEYRVKLGHLQISGSEVGPADSCWGLEVTSYLLEQRDDAPTLVTLSCELSWSHGGPGAGSREGSRDGPQLFHVYYSAVGSRASDSRSSSDSNSREQNHIPLPLPVDSPNTNAASSREQRVIKSPGEHAACDQAQADSPRAPCVSGEHTFLGSVLGKSAHALAQPVIKYRVCHLEVDLNVTQALRFTVQCVDALGQPQVFHECLSVDLPVSIQ